LFVACSIAKTLSPSYVASEYQIMTSPDGVNWTPRTVGNTDRWQSLAWSPSLELLVSVSNTNIGQRVMTSPDAVNWTLRTTPRRPYDGIPGGYNNAYHTVRWVADWGLFVAASNSGQFNHIMSSPDGINWTPHTTPIGSWQSLAFSPELGVLVAVAENLAQPTPSGFHAMTSGYLK